MTCFGEEFARSATYSSGFLDDRCKKGWDMSELWILLSLCLVFIIRALNPNQLGISPMTGVMCPLRLTKVDYSYGFRLRKR